MKAVVVFESHWGNTAAVARAIQLSHEKYCSASAMLAKTAQITTGFDIVEAHDASLA